MKCVTTTKYPEHNHDNIVTTQSNTTFQNHDLDRKYVNKKRQSNIVPKKKRRTTQVLNHNIDREKKILIKKQHDNTKDCL